MKRKLLRKILNPLAGWLGYIPAEVFKAEVDRLMEPDVEKLIYEDGKLNISLRHPFAVRSMAASFYDTLSKGPAKNYVEMQLRDPKSDTRMVVTIQRLDGKSPHQLRAEAEAERDSLIEWRREAENKLVENGMLISSLTEQLEKKGTTTT